MGVGLYTSIYGTPLPLPVFTMTLLAQASGNIQFIYNSQHTNMSDFYHGITSKNSCISDRSWELPESAEHACCESCCSMSA